MSEEARGQRRVHFMPSASQLPRASLAAASATNGEAVTTRDTTDPASLNKRLLATAQSERIQRDHEVVTEALQETLIVSQWIQSNKSNSRLATAKIAVGRRARDVKSEPK